MSSKKSLRRAMISVLAAAGLVAAIAPYAAAKEDKPDKAAELRATVQRLEQQADKLSEAAKQKLVSKYDHEMGWKLAKQKTAQPKTSQQRGSAQPRATVAGIDVSGHQQNVDWAYWWGQGKRFAYVKATEGTGYKNPYFAQQYNGSYNQGFIRGTYHFALPDRSSGATQANYFVDNGGGWSPDGKTLPGVLDIEWNPYGATCFGLSKSQMAGWIKSFSDQYKARTGRYPAMYTNTNWWNECVGNADFSATNPLWIARYSSSAGPLPAGYSTWSFWQYTSDPIDQNYWNGSYERLKVFAAS